MKKINICGLYNQLLPSINSFYNLFNYLGYTFDDLDKILLNEIEKNSDLYQDDNSYCVLIKRIMTHRFVVETRKKIKNDEDAVVLLDKYINLNIMSTNKYEDAIKQFLKFGQFLLNIGYNPNLDVIDTLLKKNDNISKVIKIVVEKNKKYILAGKSEEIFDDSILVSIIESYCILNNIDIIENDREFELNDNFYVNGLSLYYADIRNIKLLTREEEFELFSRYKNGDNEAKRILIEANLRLVASFARKYYLFDLPILDLIQEGNIGLINALENFDHNRGIKFCSYAAYFIRQSIYRYITRKTHLIKISCNKAESLRVFDNRVNKLSIKLNHTPSNEEISEYLGLSLKEIDQFNKLLEKPISLNSLIGEDDCELGEQVIDNKNSIEEIVNQIILKEDMIKAFKEARLTDREIYILEQRYGFGYNNPKKLEELGVELHITRERVRQIESHAIRKLRECNSAIEILLDYADKPKEVIEGIHKHTKNYNSKNKDCKKKIKIISTKKG